MPHLLMHHWLESSLISALRAPVIGDAALRAASGPSQDNKLPACRHLWWAAAITKFVLRNKMKFFSTLGILGVVDNHQMTTCCLLQSLQGSEAGPW